MTCCRDKYKIINKFKTMKTENQESLNLSELGNKFKTDVNKSVFNYEIERLDSGFLITKNENQRVGISNIDNLENEIKNVLSNNADVKDNLYFKGNKKVIITIVVEVIS